MNCPHLLIRILPIPGVDWVGSVNIRCLETGLVAKLSYGSSTLGLGGNGKLIRGQILDSSLMKVLCEVYGHWDRYIFSLQPSAESLYILLFFFPLVNHSLVMYFNYATELGLIFQDLC